MGRTGRRWRIGVALCAMGAVMSIGATASAATLTVNTTGDNGFGGGDGGKCTLRDAIFAVESPGTSTTCGVADTGANTIVLGAHTYTLNDNLILGIPPPTGCLQGGSSPSSSNGRGNLFISGTVQNLTIKGAGTSATVIDACRLADRALNIQTGASVTVRDLTITNGRAPDGKPGQGAGNSGDNGGEGGAIFNDGTLTLNHVTVSNSQAGGGGFGEPGTGTSSGSGGFGGLGGNGGGIFNDTGATLNLVDSTVSGNSAGAGGAGGAGETGGTGGGGNGGSGDDGGNGGGIDSLGGLSISGSTISGNQAGVGGDGAQGGTGTTMDGGTGGSGGHGGAGGGVAAESGSSSITNSTITGNVSGGGGLSAVGGDGPGGDIVIGGNGGDGGTGGIGGGLFLVDLNGSSVLNATVANNTVGKGQPGAPAVDFASPGTAGANGFGSGAFVNVHTQIHNYAPTTFTNTLFVGTGEGICATNPLETIANTFIDGGHNLAFAPPAIGPLPPANKRCPSTFADGNPKLGPLQNNLGPTLTMDLGPGSAAINQIPPGSDCPATDQRGFKRPSGPECDIGAYEVTPPAVSAAGATAVTTTVATIHGKVTANQVHATVRFQFGKTTAYGSQTTVQTAGGATAVAIAAHLTGLMPGKKYHYRVVATSSDGTSKSADATFTTKALVISGLKITPTQFQPGKPGATIKYSDSAAAKTTFEILSVQPGIKQGGKCVRPTKSQKGKACTRLVKVASFVHTDMQGKDSVQFSGVVNNHALTPGGYRLEATPQLNGATGKTVSVAFKVT